MTSLGPRQYRSRSPFQGTRSGPSVTGQTLAHVSHLEIRWAIMARLKLERYRFEFKHQVNTAKESELPDYDSKHDVPHVTQEGPVQKVLQPDAVADLCSRGSCSTVATGPQPSRRVVNRKVGLRSRPLSAGDHPIPPTDGLPSSQVRGRSWGKQVDEFPIFTPPEGSRAPTPKEASLVPHTKRYKFQVPRGNARPRVMTATNPARSCS